MRLKFVEILHSDGLTSKQIEKLIKDIFSKHGEESKEG